MTWEDDALLVRARRDSLRPFVEVTARREVVESWVRPDDLGTSPLLQRGLMLCEQRLLGWSLGLDIDGRPVIAVEDTGTQDGSARGVWSWFDDGFEEIELRPSGDATVTRFRIRDGRIDTAVTAEADNLHVHRIAWDQERPVRRDTASVWADGWGTATTHVATYDGEELRSVCSGRADIPDAENDDLAVPEQIALLHAGLILAESIRADDLVWDGRLKRPTPPASDPLAMVPTLAAQLATAVAMVLGANEHLGPVCIDVRPGRDAPLPPLARVVGTAYRNGMAGSSVEEAFRLLPLQTGELEGDVVADDLLDRLDSDTLECCRALCGFLAGPDASAATSVMKSLGDDLAGELARAHEWPWVVDPFLTLINLELHPSGGPGSGLARAKSVVGDEHVERFRAALASPAPAPGLEVDTSAARTDRAALADLLRSHGLARATEIAGAAEIGLRLRPARTQVNSRLGGPPLLPPGTPWPTHADGAPLTFLAGLDLAEVRAAGGDERLPDSGWLLFFADLHREESELTEPTRNDEHGPARVFHVRAGHEAVLVEHPERLQFEAFALVGPRPVAFDPQLTLPQHLAAGEQLGLDGYETRTYREAAMALDPWGDGNDDDGIDPWVRHWVGGHAEGAQGEPPDPDTVLLLHLSCDSAIDLQIMDAGTVQFRMPVDALAVRDWTAITAWPESC